MCVPDSVPCTPGFCRSGKVDTGWCAPCCPCHRPDLAGWCRSRKVGPHTGTADTGSLLYSSDIHAA